MKQAKVDMSLFTRGTTVQPMEKEFWRHWTANRKISKYIWINVIRHKDTAWVAQDKTKTVAKNGSGRQTAGQQRHTNRRLIDEIVRTVQKVMLVKIKRIKKEVNVSQGAQ